MAQEELDAQAARLHEMILSPAQRKLDNTFKFIEEVFQIIQALLMIRVSRDALMQIAAQKRQEPILAYRKFSAMVLKYSRFVFLSIFGLVLCRIVRAYMLYTIVDNFLRDEYKESYSTWKAMGTGS